MGYKKLLTIYFKNISQSRLKTKNNNTKTAIYKDFERILKFNLTKFIFKI